jgi:hypothetical protein
MQKRNLDNKRLDEIGRKLIKADSMRPVDVERLVANSGLFDGVRARITQTEAVGVRPSRIRWNVAAVSCGALIVAAVVFTFGTFRNGTPEVVRRDIPVSPRTDRVGSFTKSDGIAPPLERPAPQVEPRDNPLRSEKVAVRQVASKRHKQPVAVASQEGEFYALSYAGDPNETDRGGRIIRVDMPRSALFAMGVNIPLENEAEVIKTDLLVGPDGVTRAIRVVR